MVQIIQLQMYHHLVRILQEPLSCLLLLLHIPLRSQAYRLHMELLYSDQQVSAMHIRNRSLLKVIHRSTLSLCEGGRCR